MEQGSTLRSRFSRTFNRVILRRQSFVNSDNNNNGVGSSRRRDISTGTVIMPPIALKEQGLEQVSEHV